MDNIYTRVNKLYNTKGFMDRYGLDVWITAIFCTIFLLAIGYFHVMNNVVPIKADWANQKCNPAVIPFAGIINNTSSTESNLEFTASNFSGCINSILSNIVGYAFQPFYYLMNLINTEFQNLLKSINSIRGEFDTLRNNVSDISDDVMSTALNTTMPIVQTTIVGKSIAGKAVGGVAATIYSFFGMILGTESAFSSVLSAMWSSILILLGVITTMSGLALALVVAQLYPAAAVAAGVAAVDSIILIAASILYALLAIIASDAFDLATPTAPSKKDACFSENTIVKLKKGKKTFSSLQPGDILYDGSKVTSIQKCTSYGHEIYKIDDIIVTGNHSIFHKDRGWISVDKHPKSCKIEDFREPFVYCINTDTKTIKIAGYTFSDWDDLDDKDLNELSLKCYTITPLPKDFTKKDIHKYLDSGFHEDTIIELEDGNSVKIKDIDVNDTLRFGDKVIGIVKICAKKMEGVREYYLENGTSLKCTGNIMIIKPNLGNTFDIEGTKLTKEIYIYHLLTNTGYFVINGTKIGDYNTGIEKYLSGYELKYASST
jgi:hypothetical protein